MLRRGEIPRSLIPTRAFFIVSSSPLPFFSLLGSIHDFFCCTASKYTLRINIRRMEKRVQSMQFKNLLFHSSA